MKLRPAVKDRGIRLDLFVARHIEGISRSRIQKLIAGGHVTEGGQRVSAHAKVKEGMELEVVIPAARSAEIVPQNIPIRIIHEDSDIVVLNKPSGMVVHPAKGHADGTLVNALVHHCRDLKGIGGERRPGIVHRLDKDTSGVLVAAKNQKAMENLIDQFKSGSVRKQYVALVHGIPARKEGRIETVIGRSRGDRRKMSATPKHGRRAVTIYRVAASYPSGYSLVNVRIETGRTHQIRVHMAHIGHPVAGDLQYGGGAGGGRGGVFTPARQMLHAESISFIHPSSGDVVSFRAPLPADMRKAIKAVGRGA